MADCPSGNEDLLDPAQAYRAFEAFFAPIERRITERVVPFAGYPIDAVSRRLAQRVVEQAVYPFIQVAAGNYARGMSPVPSAAAHALKLGGLRFRDGRVMVTPATWLRSVAEFCVQWIRVIGCLAGRGRDAIPTRATLLSGVGPADLAVDGSDARFLEFCARGPLPPLRDADHLIVESAQSLASSQPTRVSYARQPLLALLHAHPPRGSDLLRFVVSHLAAAASYLRYSLSHPLACLLARDMAFHAPAVDLNRRGALEGIVITNSHFHVQPLWMRALPGRRFKVHMAWYSQNTVPVVYKRNGLRADMPQYRHMAVDAHWVWTEGYAAYLKSLGTTADLHVVGPILWYLPEDVPDIKPSASVAIFDVTPVRDAFAQEIGLPRNYYSTANMIAFLEQATAACERVSARLGRPVEVMLKHKRSYHKVHDPRYIEFVDQLVAAGKIKLIPPQTNLYSLISTSSAIVVVPFSSPAYVASAVGVPAIYLDATDSIEATQEPAPFVDFASGEAVLAEKLYSGLQAHRREGRHA